MPDRPTVIVEFVAEVLLIISWPVAAPVVVGSNVNVNVNTWPGFNTEGSVTADAENPLPETDTEFTVTAAVPLDVSVSVCVVGVLTATAPKAILDAFTLRAAVPAFSCSDTARDVLPVVAVTVALCVVVTDATFAVKFAVVAVAGTSTDAGTTTEALLLARPTLSPPVGADPVKLMLHTSAREPVIEVLLHEIPLTVGATAVPVPLSDTVAVEAVLLMVNCPVVELAVVGLNCTVRTVDCPGLNVTGKAPPETENPAPEIEAELTVTPIVPLEVSVTD